MQRRFMVSLILVAIGLPAVALARPAHPNHPLGKSKPEHPAQSQAPRRLPSHVDAVPLPIRAREADAPDKAKPQPGTLKRPLSKRGLKRPESK